MRDKNSFGLTSKISKRDLKKILFNHSFWERNVRKFKNKFEVSWGDINIINMEIANIRDFLQQKDMVLDAGCSNGYSTIRIAHGKKLTLKAFDYSQKSINQAIKSGANSKDISFYHANILNIQESNNYFDIAYTIRVLINLPSWHLQKKAILELHRVLKKGGLLLLSEAFLGSLKKINKLRKLGDMPPLQIPEFNLYLEEKNLESFVKKKFDIISVRKFSSIYYVASRFLRYLTMEKCQNDSFINPFNNYFSKFKETEHSGDFGIQKLYVLKKI